MNLPLYPGRWNKKITFVQFLVMRRYGGMWSVSVLSSFRHLLVQMKTTQNCLLSSFIPRILPAIDILLL